MMNKKMPILYNIGKVLIGWIYNLYYNPKVINGDYIPKDGPILIVGNHKHVYDQFSAILSTNNLDIPEEIIIIKKKTRATVVITSTKDGQYDCFSEVILYFLLLIFINIPPNYLD